MIAMYSLRRRPQIRSGLFWIISSWTVATAIGLAIAAVMTGASEGRTPVRGGTLAGLSPTQPLLGGQQIALANASSAVGFSVPIPDTQVASRGTLTATWAVASRQQVALVFGQGALTATMQPADYKDPASEFSAFVSETNSQASLGKVDGLPTLVITPGTDYYKTNPAWVEFDLNGIDINIFSASYSTDQLLAVADSMVQSTPSPGPSPSSSAVSPGPSSSPGAS
jgi:hypothetical protein